MVYLIAGLVAGSLASYFYPENADYNVWLSGYLMGVTFMMICDIIEDFRKK